MRPAIVHDYLLQYGGAEKVLEALHALWPQAPIYTTFYDRRRMARLGLRIAPEAVRPLLPGWLPHRGRAAKLWTLSYPPVWQSLNLQGYDLVISSSSFAAHQVRVAPGALHLCYCHSPPRFLYGLATDVDHDRLRRALPLLGPAYVALRAADRRAARRVSVFIANSREVQGRIERWYGRAASVIYPPVDTAAFTALERVPDEGYFLAWGRLVALKRMDLIVEAANAAAVPLVLAGSGPEEGRLRALAGPTVRMLGRVAPADLRRLLQRCRAVVFAAEEDFGIVPVEAMAAGKPVLAYGRGGALESVEPGRTGELFAPQIVTPLRDLLLGFDPARYDPAECRRAAARFDTAIFASRMRALVGRLCGTSDESGAHEGLHRGPPIR